VQHGFRAGEVTTGLVNRLLVARLRPADYRVTTAEYPPDVFMALTARIAAAIATMPHAGIVGYTTEAADLWAAAKPVLEADDGPGADILARAAGHVARVALIVALIEGHDRIEVADLRVGLAVWDACRASALLLFGAMTGDPDADRIYAIVSQHGGRMTRTQLRDALGRHGRRADIEHALVYLAAKGLVRRRRRKTGRGRPEEVIEAIDLMRRDLSDIGDISDLSHPPDDIRSPGSPMSPGSRQHPPDATGDSWADYPTSTWADDDQEDDQP
jgi:hypothetical protein